MCIQWFTQITVSLRITSCVLTTRVNVLAFGSPVYYLKRTVPVFYLNTIYNPTYTSHTYAVWSNRKVGQHNRGGNSDFKKSVHDNDTDNCDNIIIILQAELVIRNFIAKRLSCTRLPGVCNITKLGHLHTVWRQYIVTVEFKKAIRLLINKGTTLSLRFPGSGWGISYGIRDRAVGGITNLTKRFDPSDGMIVSSYRWNLPTVRREEKFSLRPRSQELGFVRENQTLSRISNPQHYYRSPVQIVINVFRSIYLISVTIQASLCNLYRW